VRDTCCCLPLLRCPACSTDRRLLPLPMLRAGCLRQCGKPTAPPDLAVSALGLSDMQSQPLLLTPTLCWPCSLAAVTGGAYVEPLTPEQQHQAFLSRLLLMLGSFVIMVRCRRCDGACVLFCSAAALPGQVIGRMLVGCLTGRRPQALLPAVHTGTCDVCLCLASCTLWRLPQLCCAPCLRTHLLPSLPRLACSACCCFDLPSAHLVPARTLLQGWPHPVALPFFLLFAATYDLPSVLQPSVPLPDTLLDPLVPSAPPRPASRLSCPVVAFHTASLLSAASPTRALLFPQINALHLATLPLLLLCPP
jgi:hypothetical protein